MSQASKERKLCLQRIAESPEFSIDSLFTEAFKVATQKDVPSVMVADISASATSRVEIDTSDEIIGRTGNESGECDDDVDEWVKIQVN
jgi:hypothetical protein